MFQAHQGRSPEAAEAQAELVLRYGGAVHRYLLASLRDVDAADELSQEFALRFLRGDFKNADPGKGRFRDFLKRSIYRLMVDYHRARRARPRSLDESPEPAIDTDAWDRELDRQFLESWREQLMAHAWCALDRVQERRGQPFADVLRLRVASPGLRSPQLAERLSERLGPTGQTGLGPTQPAPRPRHVRQVPARRGEAVAGKSTAAAGRRAQRARAAGVLPIRVEPLRRSACERDGLRIPESARPRSALPGGLPPWPNPPWIAICSSASSRCGWTSSLAMSSSAAIRAWALEMERSRSTRSWSSAATLAEDERSLLEPLVGKQLEQLGDDVERSHEDVSSVSWIKLDTAGHCRRFRNADVPDQRRPRMPPILRVSSRIGSAS